MRDDSLTQDLLMDLKTSFVFYFVSMALYVSVLAAMALVDKRVIGTRWLAYSVLVEMMKTGLQMNAASLPRLLSTMTSNVLVVVSVFTMYMGLRWFVHRQPLRSRAGPLVMLALMAVYCAMFVLHIRYASLLISAMVLYLCGMVLQTLWEHKEERFRIPGAITQGLVIIQIVVVVYRAVLAYQVYQGPVWQVPVGNSRWNDSMLALVMIANCLLIMYVWFAAAEMYSAVEATAGIDVLTGCLNRRALMKLAAHEIARSERSGMPLTVVVIDLDHFKLVNDNYGHAGGDATLCAVVALLQNRLRSVDVVARIGGEEFLLLLPDTDAISGAKVVEGLRQAVEAMRVQFEEREITTTMSAGVTQGLQRSDSWTAMMNRADRALYDAKSAGRNRVVVDELATKLPRRALGVRTPEGEAQVGAGDAAAVGGALRLIRKRLG
jgi:diguanylate cyclase (GGDEF)-like protein